MSDNPPVRIDPPTLTPVVIPDWHDNGGPPLYGVPLNGQNVYGLDSYMIDLTKRTTSETSQAPPKVSTAPALTWYEIKRQERIEAMTSQQARPTPRAHVSPVVTDEKAPIGVQAFTACFLAICVAVVIAERWKRRKRSVDNRP
jgi:hypothetical protein